MKTKKTDEFRGLHHGHDGTCHHLGTIRFLPRGDHRVQSAQPTLIPVFTLSMNSFIRVLAPFGLLLGCSGPVFGAVIFVSTPELRGFGIGIGSWPGLETFTGPSWECDFDGDGTPEVLISSVSEGVGYSGVYSRPYSSVEILSAPYPQTYVVSHGISLGLLGGDAIHADTLKLFDPYWQVRWADQNFRTGKFDMLTEPTDAGQDGTFVNQIRYLGVRFQKSDGWHYGWIGASGDNGGLDFYDYAWETEPDKAIIAGVIPEPASLLLLGTASMLFAMTRRRKTSSTDHSPRR